MMVYEISNGLFTASIQDLGAELTSVRSADGTEFIFQPSELWAGQAKTLFPNVGLAKDDYALIRGRKYPMHQHGFLKDCVMDVAEHTKSSITFVLESDDYTAQFVPYFFSVYIRFCLEENHLTQTFRIVNEESEELYFGLASHTGFCTDPDSYVDFMGNSDIYEVCRREMKYLTGERKTFPTEDGILPVSPKYYSQGARILDNFSKKKLTLVNPNLKTSVEIEFHDFDRITLWSTPDAKTVLCMMPWLALPDYEDTNHIFEQKPGNVCVKGHSEFEVSQRFTWIRNN